MANNKVVSPVTGILIEMLAHSFAFLGDEEADELLANAVRELMLFQLSIKRQKGRGGWHTGSCTNAKLKSMLIDHVAKGDMVDVINLAAMIHLRLMIYGDEP